MKKILIIAATHGDEKIGIEVIDELLKQGYEASFDFIIANPRAEKRNVRFLDTDLNRAYPGDKLASSYEKRRASKILSIAQKYQFVIDLHEAREGYDDFIIIPKKHLPENFPVGSLNLDRVLLWPNPRGPLGGEVENAVELEFGMKNRNRKIAVRKAVDIVKNFIENMDGEKCSSNPKQIFYVYGKIKVTKNANYLSRIKDFQEVQLQGEKFYPLLVNQYADIGILCYKMKKIKNLS